MRPEVAVTPDEHPPGSGCGRRRGSASKDKRNLNLGYCWGGWFPSRTTPLVFCGVV